MEYTVRTWIVHGREYEVCFRIEDDQGDVLLTGEAPRALPSGTLQMRVLDALLATQGHSVRWVKGM